MNAYAVALIQETRFGPAIREYLEKIDATLSPFSGRFVVQGGPYIPLEGPWSADLIVIEFPTMAMAEAWYKSPGYTDIKSLRADNTEGTVFLVQGVPDGHKAADILS